MRLLIPLILPKDLLTQCQARIDLLNGYLEALNDFISESQKGQEGEVENKEHKEFMYYQDSAEPDQDKACTLRNCSRNRDGVEKFLAEEEKATLKFSKESSLGKEEDKTVTYCQQSAEIGSADETFVVGPCYRKESEVRSVEDKRIEIQIDEFEVFNLTEDVIYSSEEEKDVYLYSYIKIPIPEAHLEMPYLSTEAGALESEVLEEKNDEIDLEKLISDYLEVVKGWPSRLKGPKAEIGYPLKINNIKDLNKIKLKELNKKEEAKINNVPVGPGKCAYENCVRKLDEFKRTSAVKIPTAKKPVEKPPCVKESYRNRLVNKIKTFDYYQKAANGENISERAFEYYKKSTDTGSANGAFMVGNCYHNESNSDQLHNLQFCSQHDTSAVKDEKGNFDLDSIEGRCPKKKDHDGPDDNHHENLDLRPNGVESMYKNNIYNNYALINSIEANGNNGIVVLRKVSTGKVGHEKKVVNPLLSPHEINEVLFMDFARAQSQEGAYVMNKNLIFNIVNIFLICIIPQCK
ncbi:hypothetical protein C2G38_2166598 [Gigaspora rosea]|uniref:Uncharacterized protein n=1 Tax=Gigaspora rosea TaxID=44941 RepID=A0A397VRI1_9GLOM|nr:hypothetical protein C2G38_2166598 [Gigaspora rosea]